MTRTMENPYDQGLNTGIALLDASTSSAAELLQDWRYAEEMYGQCGRYDLVEYCAGVVHTLQEFLDDKAT